MEILNITEQSAEIQTTIQELILVKNAVNQVSQSLSNFDLNARLGVSPEEIKEFYQLIEQLIQEIR